MTRLIEVLISLAIVLGLFLVISLVLPSSRHLTQKVETNRRMTIVYDTLDSLRRFNDWNPLVLHDPRMQMKLSGPASGVGARLDYSSKEPSVGNGSWELVADEPGKSVTYAVVNPQRGHDKKMTFTLKPTGRSGRNVFASNLKVWTFTVGSPLFVTKHVPFMPMKSPISTSRNRSNNSGPTSFAWR